MAAAVFAMLSAQRVDAQTASNSFENLQVLPKDISRTELFSWMGSFTNALGVRCNHCHAASSSGSGLEYPSDEKQTKRRARVMLRMVNQINGQHLPGLPGRSESGLTVTCETCHRGQTRPVLMSDSLRTAYLAGGLDSMERVYRQLREQYFGSHTFDFRWSILRNLSTEMINQQNYEDALATFELNDEFFPDNPRVAGSHAVGMVEIAMNQGGAIAGREAYDEAVRRFSPDVLSDNSVNALGYRLLRAEKVVEAIEVFKINIELHPESWNAYDSLGEGYMTNGDTELAIQYYERSVEMNPDNTNGIEILRRLRGN